MPDAPDQLLARARAGHRDCLIALLEHVGPPVRARIASKLVGPWRALLDEDDVMQVTYLEAVLRFESFATGNAAQFGAWVSRLAENNLIDAIRSLEAARRPGPSKQVHPAADSASALYNLLGATMTTPSRIAARGEAASLLDSALATLPPDYQRVVNLYDLAGKSIKEVASEMGRSEGAVFMLRARAHERLRESLGHSGNYFSSPGS